MWRHAVPSLKQECRIVYHGVLQGEMGIERHFDKKQAAEFLGVSPYTIIAWKKRGVLGFTRLGRAIRYPESELLRLSREGFHEAKNRCPPELGGPTSQRICPCGHGEGR